MALEADALQGKPALLLSASDAQEDVLRMLQPATSMKSKATQHVRAEKAEKKPCIGKGATCQAAKHQNVTNRPLKRDIIKLTSNRTNVGICGVLRPRAVETDFERQWCPRPWRLFLRPSDGHGDEHEEGYNGKNEDAHNGERVLGSRGCWGRKGYADRSYPIGGKKCEFGSSAPSGMDGMARPAPFLESSQVEKNVLWITRRGTSTHTNFSGGCRLKDCSPVLPCGLMSVEW